jgi:serine/threonine-protein kinase
MRSIENLAETESVPNQTQSQGKREVWGLMNEAQVGDVFDGRFTIVDTINRGGMAAIYKALDRVSGKHVALKVPFMHCESDPGFYSRFQREEMIGLTLDHPSVVRFIQSGTKKERPYIAMEFLEGQTLAQRLREAGGRLPETDAVRIASQVCDALHYLHRNGIVHRDLKPENIMLCRDGSLRIMDFGIARANNSRRLTFGGLSCPLGTPDYISPEQVKGKRGDGRTDIYSLGAMLYVMLTGAAPYEGDSPYIVMNARLTGDPEAPRAKNPQLSLQMEEIILHAMEREPSDRYISVVDMKAELNDYAKVALKGRFKKVRPPHFLSEHMPVLRNMAIILAVQALLFLALVWHFNHKHAHAVNPPTPSIVTPATPRGASSP